jgi:hypothetical protein
MRYTSPNGAYHVEPLPSMPQVAWCHGFWVAADQRGNGHGRELEQCQAETLSAELYDYALTTTAADNHAKQACLRGAGWTLLATFDNSRTGQAHQVWGRNNGGADDRA